MADRPTSAHRALRALRLLHVYGALACCPWLLVLGLSALEFQHGFAFLRARDDAVRWTRPVGVPRDDDAAVAAEALRERLGIAGWTLPWETRVDADGGLHVVVESPGRRCVIDASPARGEARVDEVRHGWWRTIIAMHGLGAVPGAPLASAWGWYTTAASAMIVAAAASGVALWAARVRRHLGGWGTLAGAAVASLWLVALIVARG